MADREKAETAPQRPRPPEALFDPMSPAFAPAPEVEAWLRETFIVPGGRLSNPDHAHLDGAFIGVLWTIKPHARRMRDVVGQAEMPQFQGNQWSRARQEQQMMGWFGDVPDFVLTFSAHYAAQCSDAEWCALVEHELYHCAQARDAFGGPRFNRDTGAPVFAIRGHDVEEFVGVVRRYGAMGAVAEMVDAAGSAPEVAIGDIAGACGTCRL